MELCCGKGLLSSKRRFAVAMWDFSWLVRRNGIESEYEDWDQVLFELRERGYDCIRIDPFPHLLATGRKNFNLPALRGGFMWGHHNDVRVDLKSSLITFLQKAADCGLAIALSSWFLDDSEHERRKLSSPEYLAQVWIDTLSLLEQFDLLKHIAWVDLCNEFPMSVWAPAPHRHIFGLPFNFGLLPSVLILNRPWGKGAIHRFGNFISESLGLIKRAFPEQNYTFSFQSFGSSNVGRAQLSELDLLEVHLWMSDSLIWSLRSGHCLAALGLPGGVRFHAFRAKGSSEETIERFLHQLEKRMKYWAALASNLGIPLVTSEGWVSTFYRDLWPSIDEWGWFKATTCKAIDLAIKNGWVGICSSNFCQPHFRGFWEEVGWHKNVTNRIKGL